MSVTSSLLRKTFKAGDDARDKGLRTPDHILRQDDIAYGEDPRWQVLDVYRPRDAEGQKLPVIVSVHGGGWVYGTKETYQFYCMDLAARGFAVVNYTYRLAPEHKFPAPVEDACAVFGWVRANAERYGFDTDHVFAVGDSAGAQILTIFCCMCTDPAYARRFSFRPPEGFVPRAVALNCGAYSVDDEPRGLTAALMADYLPGKGTPEELETLRVLDHITDAFPPAFVMTATEDFLRQDAPVMAAALAGKDVPFVYRFYGDRAKRLPHVFHCDIRSEDAKLCNDEECAFFREFL